MELEKRALEQIVYDDVIPDPEEGTPPSEEEAESILAAAEPHLRKKWADEARKLLNMRADFQGPHATARNRGIHDVIALLEGAGE